MVDIRERLGLTGIQFWLFLGCLGGYFALPLLALVDNPMWALIFLIGYLFFIVMMGVLIYLSKLSESAGVSVIRGNVTTSQATEEEDVLLRVEYPVDLQIETDIDVKLFDDYPRFEDLIIKQLNLLLSKKLEVLEKKYTLLQQDPANKEKKEEFEQNRILEMQQIQNWVKSEFNPNPELHTTLYAYWVKLSKKLSFEDTPDSEFDKVIILTRRPWEEEFPFKRKEEYLDGYFIKCKATRAEFIKLQSIIDTIPILFSNYTPTDSQTQIKVALESITINSVRARTMAHIIDNYKMQFSDHFSLADQYEKRIEDVKEEKNILEQRLLKAQKQRISTLGNGIKKTSNVGMVLLSIWAFISIILLIMQRN